MSFPRYPKYKDSATEWPKQVPEHWAMWKVAHAFRVIGSGTTPKSDIPEYYENGEIAWVNTGDLHDADLTDCERRVTELAVTENSALRLYPAGSLLIAMYGATIGKLALLRFPATVNQACCVLAEPIEISPEFMFYWLLAFRERLLSLATGGGQPNISQEVLRNLRVTCPKRAEQACIVEFLNRETAKIDALVTEQRRLMEVLKEKRQAVISHAVTKGLNPHASMKDSGIEWLGKVPAHWNTMPIRFAAKLESGHTPSRQRAEYWENCVVPWFTLADVWQIREGADFIFKTEEKVSELGLANSSARLLPKGTVMLSRTASVGLSAIMGVDMATTQDFANWICGPKLLPEFLLFVLRSMEGEFGRLKMGSTHNTIYMPDIQALRFALPPNEEQAEIVRYLREAIQRFDALLADIARSTNLLLERRTALISAAVTGQIDVRGIEERLSAA